ncbi:MAG: hypothetical protein ABSC54_06025 [Smithellaceae bacterium]|jgi:hypothetical protein
MKRFNLVVMCLVVLGLVASASLSYAAPKSKAAAKPVANANIDGKWYFSVTTPTGTGNPVFTFKLDGNKLTGNYAGRFGEAPLTGTMKGDNFEVKYVLDGATTVYKGKINGDKVSGTCNLGGQVDGTFEGDKIKN